MAITAVDLQTPAGVHLGPALVIAPALTASFRGPRATAVVGALAVAAQIVIAALHGGLGTLNHIVQIVTLVLLTLLIVFLCAVRERRTAQLTQVRTVAEAAQHVLLWPLPEQIGPLKVACLYLAAEDEAQVGGDLYAATRTEHGTRVVIGDVRGKGMDALGEAALVIAAFREAAHQHSTLPCLAASLEQSVTRYLADFEPSEEEAEAEERFATALLVEIPDVDPITRLTSCGHLAPLLLSPGNTVTTPSVHPAPPLGLGLTDLGNTLDVFSFEAGDTLLLFTDGVVEARDHNGDFYPLEERAAQWTDHSPEVLLHHLRRDLLHHVGGRLGDDAAIVAINRTPTR